MVDKKALTLTPPELHPKAHDNPYLHASTSNNTRTAYQADVRHFIRWGGLLPCTPDVILRYLQAHAPTLNPRTLARRLTALKHWHTYQGFADPTTHPAIRKTLVGIKNVHGKPKDKALPLTLAHLSTLCASLSQSNQLIDSRNRALILLGFFGAFRRSELVNIRWEDITHVPEGIEILIPRSKTDQGGEGQVCAIPHGQQALICPILALADWQSQSGLSAGPVFRRLTQHQAIEPSGIQAQQVNLIIKALAREAGLPKPEHYSSHSLRRGFATEASKNGAPFGAIMRHGRWRHEGTVLGYIDEGTRFDQNAVSFMLKNKGGQA